MSSSSPPTRSQDSLVKATPSPISLTQHLVEKLRETSLQELTTPLQRKAEETYAGVLQTSSAISSSKMKLLFSVDLFGRPELHVDVYEYVGDLPLGVHPPSDGSRPLYQRVALQSLSISALFPELKGSPFDLVSLADVSIIHQNCLIDDTKGIGWSLECQANIGSNIGDLNEVARMLLGVDHLGLRLHANFGPLATPSWHTPLTVPSFTLQGMLDMNPIALGTNLTLINVGISLQAVRADRNVTKQAALTFSWELLGEMSLSLPGETKPSLVDFSLTERSDVVYIHGALQGDVWENALGIRGVNLSRVCVDIDFELTKRPRTFDFQIRAELRLYSSTVDFFGKYSEANGAELSASLSHISIKDIQELYQSLIGSSLSTPSMDILIQTAILSLSNKTGVRIMLRDVAIEGTFIVDQAELDLHNEGAQLTASMHTDPSLKGDLTISNAQLSLFIACKGSEQSSHFLLNGKTTCSWFPGSPIFNASVYLYKPSGANNLEYTLYGSVVTNDTWTIGHATSGKCPEFMKNVALRRISILAASMDKPEVGPLVIPDLELRKGVQICAQLDEIQQINGVMRGSCPLLNLYVTWPELAFTIALPTANTIDFGHGFKTDTVHFTIDTENLALLLSAGITYTPVSKGDPLSFTLILSLGKTSANATVDSTMSWNNPLNISPEITVKELALQIGVVYEQFLTTGIPSTLGVLGKFQIGTATDDVTLVFGDNPSDELLKIDLYNMDVNELIRLVSNIADVDLHPFPDGAVILERSLMYASPYGATVGEHVYDSGFSADLAMKIFSHHLDGHLRLDRTGFVCQASFDHPLEIGPLSVKGYLAQYPQTNIELTALQQLVSVDGQIQIGDLYCALNAKLTPKPHPAFSFSLVANLFGAYKLTLLANLNSPPADWQYVHQNSSGFSFSGDFSEEACTYLSNSVTSHLPRLGPNTTVDKTHSTRAVETLFNSRLRVTRAESGLRARLSNILRSHSKHKETLRRLSKERSTTFNHYWTDLQNTRARLDAAQRTYDAELKSKLFTLRQAQAKAAADSRQLKRLLEAEEARLPVLAELTAVEIERLVSRTITDTSRFFTNPSVASSALEYPWQKSASLYHAIQQRSLARKLSFVQGRRNLLHANIHAQLNQPRNRTTVISRLRMALQDKENEAQACNRALQAAVKEHAEMKISSASNSAQTDLQGSSQLYKKWQQVEAGLAAEAVKTIPHVDARGRFCDLEDLAESQALIAEYQTLAKVVHENNIAQILEQTASGMEQFWMDAPRDVWHIFLDIVRKQDFLRIEQVHIGGRFSTNVANGSTSSAIFSLQALVRGIILGNSFEYMVDFDLSAQEKMIMQLIEKFLQNDIIPYIRSAEGRLTNDADEVTTWLERLGEAVGQSVDDASKTIAMTSRDAEKRTYNWNRPGTAARIVANIADFVDPVGAAADIVARVATFADVDPHGGVEVAASGASAAVGSADTATAQSERSIATNLARIAVAELMIA